MQLNNRLHIRICVLTTAHKAIERGDISTIKKWIEEDPTRVNECRGGSKFPRLFAVANGTVLHWAVYYGQLEIAQILLDNGAGKLTVGLL